MYLFFENTLIFKFNVILYINIIHYALYNCIEFEKNMYFQKMTT